MANYTNIECDGVYENIPDAGNIYFTSLNEYYSNNYNRTENCIQYVTELKSRVNCDDEKEQPKTSTNIIHFQIKFQELLSCQSQHR